MAYVKMDEYFNYKQVLTYQMLNQLGANDEYFKNEDVEVNGNWTFNNEIIAKKNISFQSDTNAFIGTLDNYNLSLRTNNTDRITITNTGNVGIGTTAPVTKLQIAKDTNTSSGWTDTQLTLTGETDPARRLALGFDTSNDFGYIQAFRDNDVTKNLVLQRYGGNVGIGTPNPQYTLHVNGSFAANSKNFDIPHPLDPENKRLIHATLEGPEYGLYYRGEAQLENGQAMIELPSYFEALTREEDRSVLLTNIDGFDKLCIQTQDGRVIKDGKFIVISDNPNSTQRFFWEVKAIRKDIDKLIVEKEVENSTNEI